MNFPAVTSGREPACWRVTPAPKRYVTDHIRPLIALFQDAIAVAKRRPEMTREQYVAACDDIYERFGQAAIRHSRDADVRRIYKRLNRHVDELFTFLEQPGVPPDNNAASATFAVWRPPAATAA